MRRAGPNNDPGHGDELLSSLLRGDVGGEIENRLLEDLNHGYPVHKLRLLLAAGDEKVVAAGMWLASELGERARPIFDEIVALIHHPYMQVRFFALDCVVACAGPKDGHAVRLALDLIDDIEFSVRWKALMFLATLPDGVLRAARLPEGSHDHADLREEGLQLLVDAVESVDEPRIASALVSSEAVLRAYAAAAAARLVPRHPRLLQEAMQSTDETIKQFATDMASRAGIS